ncbi:SIMPL domain-containing protein [Dehalococcoidia bacterium]|nr:SIMPL domain-containing protein [Dehalococcoidia bacterium]
MVVRAVITMGLSVVVTFAVACGNGESSMSNTSGQSAQSTTPVQNLPNISQNAIAAPVPQVPASIRRLPLDPSILSSVVQTASGQAGIWVTGHGKTAVPPDLALLKLGVEATAKTVARARKQAATAMDAIITSLTANGVSEPDIQTRHFNISPRYEYTEVVQNGIRTNKQVLIGYFVSNNSVVKIRDLDDVGIIIDDVASAGGDAARISGVSFTVEDTSPFITKLREQAVSDALAKAEQLASLTGVSVGVLVFISESDGAHPEVRGFEEAMTMRSMAAFAPDTNISGGELEISLSVEAVFRIQ